MIAICERFKPLDYPENARIIPIDKNRTRGRHEIAKKALEYDQNQEDQSVYSDDDENQDLNYLNSKTLIRIR